MVFIVLLNQVLDDGTGLPEREAGVWVLDGGDTAVGVELEEGLLLHLVELDELEVKGDVQFLENHPYFDGVRPNIVAPDDDGLEGCVGRHDEWLPGVLRGN